MKLSSSILIITAYAVAVNVQCRRQRFKEAVQPQISYRDQYSTNDDIGRNAAQAIPSLKKKPHPSLSCLLFGDDGCQLTCNLMCEIHGCHSDAFCQNQYYCQCNELYFVQNLAVTANQFRRLSLDKLLNYRFADSLVLKRLKNRILQDNELEQFVLPLLQNPHNSGKDVKEAVLAQYPYMTNVQYLEPRDSREITKYLSDDSDLQEYVHDMIGSMADSVSDRLHHVRYMKRIIRLIKNIKDEDDLLYILTQLSHINNDRLFERVRRYLIKQGYHFYRDPESGHIRRKKPQSKGKKKKNKRTKKNACKCKQNTFKNIIHDDNFLYDDDDMYDEKDEAVEMALINELVNASETDGRFPVAVTDQIASPQQNNQNSQINTHVTNYPAGNLQSVSPTPQFMQLENYSVNKIPNMSMQQQPITYTQELTNDNVPSTQYQKTAYIDNISPQQEPNYNISPSGYQSQHFFNLQPSQPMNVRPQTIVEKIQSPSDTLFNNLQKPLYNEPSLTPLQPSPFLDVKPQTAVNTLLNNLPKPLYTEQFPTLMGITSPFSAPINLQTYDVSDKPTEAIFINPIPAITDTFSTVNFLKGKPHLNPNNFLSTPTQTVVTSNYALKPESSAYLLGSDGDLGQSQRQGTFTSMPNLSNSQYQSEIQTIPSQIQLAPTEQKGKDKIYYQLIMDEDGNIIKSANYKFPGQVEYSEAVPSIPVPLPSSTSIGQTDQPLLEKFDKQQLLDDVKPETEDRINHDLLNANISPHDDILTVNNDFDVLYQGPNDTDDFATDYTSGTNHIQTVDTQENAPSTHPTGNSYNTLDLGKVNYDYFTGRPITNVNTPLNYDATEFNETPELDIANHDSSIDDTPSQLIILSDKTPSNYLTGNSDDTPNLGKVDYDYFTGRPITNPNTPSNYDATEFNETPELDIANHDSSIDDTPSQPLILSDTTPSNYNIDNSYYTPDLQIVDYDSGRVGVQSQPLILTDETPSNYNTGSTIYVSNNPTDYSYIVGPKNTNVDFQNWPSSPQYIPLGYDKTQMSNSPDQVIIDYAIDEFPITQRYKPQNGHFIYLENDIDSQIKSNDDLATDNEADDYPRNYVNGNSLITEMKNDQSDPGNAFAEDFVLHHDHLPQNVNNVAYRYEQGAGSATPITSTILTDGVETIRVMGSSESMEEHDISILHDDLENPEDDIMNF